MNIYQLHHHYDQHLLRCKMDRRHPVTWSKFVKTLKDWGFAWLLNNGFMLLDSVTSLSSDCIVATCSILCFLHGALVPMTEGLSMGGNGNEWLRPWWYCTIWLLCRYDGLVSTCHVRHSMIVLLTIAVLVTATLLDWLCINIKLTTASVLYLVFCRGNYITTIWDSVTGNLLILSVNVANLANYLNHVQEIAHTVPKMFHYSLLNQCQHSTICVATLTLFLQGFFVLAS